MPKIYELDAQGKIEAERIVKAWTDIAYKAGVMSSNERFRVKKAVKKLYQVSGLKPPPDHRIVIAPSPMVARFAAGAAAWIWYCRKNKIDLNIATLSAIDSATDSSTYSATLRAIDSATLRATNSATLRATLSATYSATDSATRSATYSATLSATYSATRSATRSAIDSATDSSTYSATLRAIDSATDRATDSATYRATRSATNSATDRATDSATYSATNRATDRATNSATDRATNSATYSATDTNKWFLGDEGCISSVNSMSGEGGLFCAQKAYRIYQGGNAWAASAAYIQFGRDVAALADKGLVDPTLYDTYQPWEELAKISGFRFMHEEFCIVSDRPTKYHVNDQNQPHCETGPFVEWSDGSAFYAVNGVYVPVRWIESPEDVTPQDVLKSVNTEQRAAGIAIFGMGKMLSNLRHETIDKSDNPQHGELIKVWLDGLSEPGIYLKAECPRNGIIAEAVPPICDITNKPIQTVLHAQAWRVGLAPSEFKFPTLRT